MSRGAVMEKKDNGGYEYEFLADVPRNRVDEEIRRKVFDTWDAMAMPLDGMGAFREITAQIGGILKDPAIDIRRKAILVMCADNGIVEEGVSQSGQEVTRIVAEGMGRGQSTVCLMAKQIGADVIPVDVGIAEETETAGCRTERTGDRVNADIPVDRKKEITTDGKNQIPGVISRTVRPGSRNFLKEPAMTRQETEQAIRTGIEMAGFCREKGYRLIGTGEMGIGNTTTSSAVAAALLKEDAAKMTGRGAGLSGAGLQKKRSVIDAAIKKYDLYEQDPLTILECAGGYDLAALAGVCIGGCVHRIPVVLDGMISMSAALAAVRLMPEVKSFLIPSHRSREPAAARLAEELSFRPVIEGRMALGEGTGAVMMMALLDLACSVYGGMRTFSDAGMDPYKRHDG